MAFPRNAGMPFTHAAHMQVSQAAFLEDRCITFEHTEEILTIQIIAMDSYIWVCRGVGHT